MYRRRPPYRQNELENDPLAESYNIARAGRWNPIGRRSRQTKRGELSSEQGAEHSDHSRQRLSDPSRANEPDELWRHGRAASL